LPRVSAKQPSRLNYYLLASSEPSSSLSPCIRLEKLGQLGSVI
jgi:hypothetical protein